jgi:hypothetical protein
MSMDDDLKRLRSLYQENSDDVLLRMDERRSDLTDLAQQALAAVMNERGLVAGASAPGAEDEETNAPEAGVALGAPVEGQEAILWTFPDTVDLSRAIGLMRDEAVPYRLWDQSAQDESRGLAPRQNNAFSLVVPTRELQRAQKLLRDELNLPPAAEVEDPFAQIGGLMVVGIFERGDALVVAQALGEAGMSYVWNDPQDDPKTDGEYVTIEVPGRHQDAAHALAERRLAELPE